MKVVYFWRDSDFNAIIRDGLRDEKDALTPPGLHSTFLRKLYRLHNARPLNRKWELPFKRPWFQFCLDESRLSSDDEILFWFSEVYRMTYSGQFLRYLRKKYPKGKFVFGFLNPVNDDNLADLERVRQYFDIVETFSRDDAAKYGFAFNDISLYFRIDLPPADLPESDVFFVGADKGRLDMLLAIYETLTAGGLRCDFHIVGVPKDKQKYADVIHYNQPLDYKEVMQHLAKSKCALEVLQGDCAYNSRRVAEAYTYRKKVLTTNHHMPEERYYSPEIVQIITDPAHIDLSFFEKEVDETVYEKCDFCSFAAARKVAQEQYRSLQSTNA